MKKLFLLLCALVIIFGSVTITRAGVIYEPYIDELLISPDIAVPPVEVNFDLLVYNPDSVPIALYEWDFDGDGTYDWSNSTSPITTHTYTVFATYNPAARIDYVFEENGTVILQGFDVAFGTLSVVEELPVPEPATMLLLGAGLVGLAGLRRKFRK